ncbi:MAG: copper chaperone PCu(A)C [Alphaproteobacteria bacterium]|nr:copper chaperone PCu(A)C [Alphaproteobacteria bacterium]
MRRRFLLFTAALTLPGVALAQSTSPLRIEQPFARATAPTARAGGAFMTIVNTGATADRLLRVETSVAARAELHTTTMEGDVMRMREVPGIDVPANGKATLAPGGFHVMLMELKAPLKAGDTAPLTLVFEKAGRIDVKVPIVPLGAQPDMQHKH